MPDSQNTPPAPGRPAKRRMERKPARLQDTAGPAMQVVGIGASAGGLEACTALFNAMPGNTGMAFILVQHLDPTHESMLVELISTRTKLEVVQATDGVEVESDHLYIIAPACVLTIEDGLLHLRPTANRLGARLPFDTLLTSLADACGTRATCIVLSGTGSDGTEGLRAIKQAGGFVIAQEPTEAKYDGMPRSAIATGQVDAVLPVAAMPDALKKREPQAVAVPSQTQITASSEALSVIIELLRAHTSHDFTLYKPGTLKRRIERRMAIAAIPDMYRYADILRDDLAEIQQLAKDLLIHVTSFFRDPGAFEILAHTVVPHLIRDCPANQPLRIWVAGCSTGEEAYSLAMVFHEQLAAANSSVKLQIFASDADQDAVAAAREGIYPAAIVNDVTSERLAAFFSTEDQNYRVLPELRAMVVFTVQDLLADPPFSRLDLVSCRNLLIYLGSAAQKQVVALFHFALRKNGILLLGSSESVGHATDRFEVVSRPARVFRRIGRNRPGEVDFARQAGDPARLSTGVHHTVPLSREAGVAELCQRLTLQTQAPATVLINRKREFLYSLGPTDRYLRVASGHASADVLMMVTEDVRTRLRTAILRAIQQNRLVSVSAGRRAQDGRTVAITIEVHPLRYEEEDLLLIHFIEHPAIDQPVTGLPATGSKDDPAVDSPRIAELERELQNTRDELQSAIQSLEISSDEQKADNENALSVNEEFQSTNEELLTSKEELQSLNEELTALNSQLQETLEQQRTTSNDLQNVLYSTDVATLFLDADLKIRFFTPATKSLFNVIKTDVGRPLADLHSLAADLSLAADAQAVLKNAMPTEHEVQTSAGVWCRRILPYKTRDGSVEGVVITFTDITAHKHAAAAVEEARREAEQANTAKSHFLAAASHDLRQPLQSLALLQGLLANRVEGEAAQKLVARLDQTVGAMSGMLNTLLDINQIEAGVVSAEPVDFPIDGLLRDLRDAFTYTAHAQGLDLRVVFSGLTVHSDPRLLEQMLRNLVTNAIKYTKAGKVLLGCRNQGDTVRIEVWDTGIGIPENELRSIFEEYRQLDNAARERSRGLGLGLSIVSRLGTLLGHRINVRSRPGKGSVFSVEVPLSRPTSPPSTIPVIEGLAASEPGRRVASVLVVEDDADVRELLALILSDDGHHISVVSDGHAALALVEGKTFMPEIVLTDFNLPNEMNGLSVAAALRTVLGSQLPVIMLTGDISTETSGMIAAQHCLQLNKPVKPAELTQAIQGLLPPAAVRPTPRKSASVPDSHTIFIIDDDQNIREAIRSLLENAGRTVQDFASGEAFLATYTAGTDGCLLIDAHLPGIGGLELLRHLRAAGDKLPAIMITGTSDVPMAVQAMKAGAADFIEKPIAPADLLDRIDHALELSRDTSKQLAWQAMAATLIAKLTPRQREIMTLVLAGRPSKIIAADLGISQRTVENHRASIMKTTSTKSIPALARLALAAVEAGS